MSLSLFEIATASTFSFFFVSVLLGLPGMIFNNGLLRRGGLLFALAGFASQTLFMVLGVHASFGGNLSAGAYIQLLAWFIMLVSLLAWWKSRNFSLVLFAAPLALMFFILSPMTVGQTTLPMAPVFYALHIGCLFLGLALIAIAGLAGIIFLAVQNRIKSRRALTGFWQDVPSLAILDNINSLCTLSAFPLFTLGLITGFGYARSAFGRTLSGDPKEIAALVTWLLLAVLFHNRLAKGWKGRKPAILAIGVFAAAFLSLVAVNFLLPSHHAFMLA